MITVFHGSIVEVTNPLVTLGRPNLDFGQGFYVTDLEQQAQRWAERMGRRKLSQPIISVYDFDKELAAESYNYLKFDAYDKNWLDFIVGNRKGRMLWQGYDVIEGGVANDNVIDTVEDYMRGRMSAEAALAELSKHQPNNQMCLLNQQVVNRCLHFVTSINLKEYAES